MTAPLLRMVVNHATTVPSYRLLQASPPSFEQIIAKSRDTLRNMVRNRLVTLRGEIASELSAKARGEGTPFALDTLSRMYNAHAAWLDQLQDKPSGK